LAVGLTLLLLGQYPPLPRVKPSLLSQTMLPLFLPEMVFPLESEVSERFVLLSGISGYPSLPKSLFFFSFFPMIIIEATHGPCSPFLLRRRSFLGREIGSLLPPLSGGGHLPSLPQGTIFPKLRSSPPGFFFFPCAVDSSFLPAHLFIYHFSGDKVFGGSLY